ncbi:IS110 family transposase [Halorubrum distributum]|uniref:Transposase (ISH18) n=1 Tax=Halorubrum distributum JCM 10247 TaxID=1227486 RepID=M0DVP1_9EURY|nr:IS110 family transposase [Halorubrum terrestre]ELZ38184.1 transposase (ISH18) [Halorubrum terrestre JCM 10247]
MYYPGIDLHKDESHVAVLDDDAEVVEEIRVANANLDEVAEEYAGAKAALEATSNYYTVYDTLDEHLDVVVADPTQTKAIGYASNYYTVYDTLDEHLDVVVADPTQTKAIGYAEVKNDRLDAKLLAQLRRAGMIAESYVPSEEFRERRALVRGRKRLVEKRTDFKNEDHAVLDKHGITYDWDPFSVNGREILAGEDFSLGVIGDQLMESFLSIIDELTAQIEELEPLIEETAASLEETQLLMTIPGVSFYSSLLITSEIGETDRFDKAKQVVSYAGLNPVVRESGDSRTEGSISKCGSGDLRWILVQCVQTAVHRCNDPYLGRFYARLKQRKNHQIAIVATARKLLVSIFHMLEREEVYDPPEVSA